MEKFVITKDFTKRVNRFKLGGRTTEFKIKPIPENIEPVSWVRGAVEEIVKKSTDHLQPNDQVGITFCSKDFGRGPGYMKFKSAGELKVDDIWLIINGIFQSNSTGLNTDTFCLGVTSVSMPKGKGRGKRYNTFNEESAMRKGIVTIENTDNLCLPRALVVAIAKATNDPKYVDVRRDIKKLQSQRALDLVECSGIIIPEEGAGIEELKQFQQYLKEYKITVYQHGSKGRDIIFKGLDASKKINLLYRDGHYNVITSLTAAFCCGYFCEECHVPYNTKNRHRCGGKCAACQQEPSCIFEHKIKCQKCNRSFRNQNCFDNHQKSKSLGTDSVCDQIRQCNECLKTVKSDRKHTCGEIFCKICQDHLPEGHLCYMQPDHRKPKKDGFLFVFYDLESRQETVLENGDLLHEPNLCVFKQVCSLCINSKDNWCKTCGDRVRVSLDNVKYNVLKKPPVEWMMNHIMKQRKIFKQVVVVAHNGQAYDHQFVLNYILTKTHLIPELIMRGSKIVQMVVDNVKFIDSLNFFPMALSKLPKAFDLGDEFKKGYFPHLFNRTENDDYVGPLPSVENYCPDTMKDNDRYTFLAWHDKHKNDVFDFKKEIVEYCTSDVEILTQACLKFRTLLLSAGNVCPLTESCTIASACNKVYRRNYLKPNTIGIIPKGGYRFKDNQSKIATQWLVWEEKERNINIVHSAKQREAVVKGVKVDGYCDETLQVFEFHGCFYHGCPSCYKLQRDEPLVDEKVYDSLNVRLENTRAKTDRLREFGYTVIEMWECEFRRKLSVCPDIQEYTTNHPLLVAAPLKPRDAFYGGRTGNIKEYYKAVEGEKIKYVDVCSLYPWACKYGKFPIGHPQVLVGHEQCSSIDLCATSGLIKCSILPPQNLFHPVLPLKMNDKLMFVLCRECGDEMDKSVDCTHTEGERTLHGTWVIEEVAKALEMGYKIVQIHEIWKYQVVQYDPNTKTGGLFAKMMNDFIKYKTEASDWPSKCSTQEEKDSYIDEFFNREGVRLEEAKMLRNDGLRSLAKLILNSFWGKLGQRENQPKTLIVDNPEDLFNMLSNPTMQINGILPINDRVVVVNYETIEEAYDPLCTVNVSLAAYTTAHARLKLYSYLEKLGDRVLYYDTDSVIYIGREDEFDIPLGCFTGEMTDELEGYGKGAFIVQFASGGPKNYGYEVFGDKGLTATAKVKGITLNYQTSQLINFEKIKDMILKDSEPVFVVTKNILRTAEHLLVTREERKKYKPSSTKRKFENHDSVPYGFKKCRFN